MRQLKPCDICGIKIGKYNCKICNSWVCEDHYIKEKGICTNCVKFL